MRTDAELQCAIQDELDFEPSVIASDIGVTVKEGIATLFGTVSSYAEKWAAERAAERVSGLRALAKDLTVKLPGDSERSDADIAAAALHALAWNVQVPDKKLQVEVQNGFVTLKGQVDWNYQREAAAHDVRKLTGVVGVGNQISLAATASAKEVRSKIESALQRRAVKDARRITVEADGGRVILRGEVHCWGEREDAEQAAWAAPGVSEVQDQIRIQP
ncbi:MAG: BON domain-containing protein [Archangium sp.]